MNKQILSSFRQTLRQHRDAIVEWLNSNSPEKKNCLCNEEPEKCSGIISAYETALTNIEHEEFGKCRLCEGEVEVERLELDFTTSVCLEHYSDAQLRDLEKDLELAAKVQRHLLPSTVPVHPHIQVSVYSEPAQIVGGDYYDFFVSKSGGQGFVIADVMGKGLPASMLMSNLQASLRILGPDYDQPNEVAVRLNQLFRYNLKLIKFISIFLGTIDPLENRLYYCNSGHHPPILWRAAQNSLQQLDPTGPAIGLIHEPDFKTETLTLEAGDLLLLYTDGLVEARNSRGEEFGEERLAAYMKAHAGETAEEFLQGLRQGVGKFVVGKLQDDLTLLAIKMR